MTDFARRSGRALRRSFRWLHVVLFILARPAYAQSGPGLPRGPIEIETGPSASSVQAPELLRFVEADYPEEAMAAKLEADVVLALLVGADGNVIEAKVVEPAGHGFDEAAQKAALRFVFRPARRGDRNVKARILYRYAFHLRPAKGEEPAPRSALHGILQSATDTHAIAGARVRVFRGREVVAEVTSAADGAFLVEGLDAGTYHVEVEAPGFQPYRSDEELSSSEETDVHYGLVPAAEQPLSVTVRGVRPSREVTRRTISRRELSVIPGTSGDALRAIQNLPGVARAPALSGLLVVRGNADQTTPVFIDGLWVPNVYHFGGLSSVVPTEMLDEINFYPGNFSVRYGRALAGVVDAHLRETRQDGSYHGLAELDLLDARAMAEGPVPLAKGWNFIGGFRRSHLDAWLAPLLKNRDTYITAAPVYYDYQFFIDHHPSTDSYLRIGVLGFDDRLRIVNQAAASGGQLDNVNATLGLGLIYKARLADQLHLQLTLATSRSHQRATVSTTLIDTVALGTVGRGELEWRLGPSAVLRTGFDAIFAPYTASGQLPSGSGSDAPTVDSPLTVPPATFDRNALFFVPALYAEMDMHPNHRTQVVTGLRADYTYETRRLDLAPRMTARYDVVSDFPRTTLKGGTGLFFQPPNLIELALKDESTSLLSPLSFQNSLGAEQELTDHLTASVEGFFNLLDHLVTQAIAPDGTLRYNNNGKGRIFGAELMLRYRADEHFFGWLAYTLSRSERTLVPGQPSHLFDLDQTHILTVLGSYRLGRGWETGLRFRLVSGNLYTPCVGNVFSSAATSYLCIRGPLDSERLPPFHQLDLRIEKQWTFSPFNLSVYLDVINVYNRKNPDFMQYNYDFTSSRAATASLPFIPSLGLRGEF